MRHQIRVGYALPLIAHFNHIAFSFGIWLRRSNILFLSLKLIRFCLFFLGIRPLFSFCFLNFSLLNLGELLFAIGAGIFNFCPFLNTTDAKVMVAVYHCLFVSELFHANVAGYRGFFVIITWRLAIFEVFSGPFRASLLVFLVWTHDPCPFEAV